MRFYVRALLALLCSHGLSGLVFAAGTGEPPPTFKPASIQSLILMGPEIMVSANVVRSTELVTPQRTIQPAAGWDFFNTVG